MGRRGCCGRVDDLGQEGEGEGKKTDMSGELAGVYGRGGFRMGAWEVVGMYREGVMEVRGWGELFWVYRGEGAGQDDRAAKCCTGREDEGTVGWASGEYKRRR